MITNAIAAAEFRRVRQEADMPVATPGQIKRALRLVTGNPMHRHMHTPLGVELLALRVPLDRQERKALKLQPARIRGEAIEVEARPENVKAFFEAVNPKDAAEWVHAVCRATGRTNASVAKVAKRIARFVQSGGYARSGGRMPTHIRRAAVDMSAIAQGLELIAARDAAKAEG